RARQQRGPGDGLAARTRQLGEELLVLQLVLDGADHRLGRDLDDPAIESPQRFGEGDELLARRRAARGRLAVVGEEVRRREGGRARAATASRTSAAIAACSSAVAARSVAAAPITRTRTAEWPTNEATFTPTPRDSSADR